MTVVFQKSGNTGKPSPNHSSNGGKGVVMKLNGSSDHSQKSIKDLLTKQANVIPRRIEFHKAKKPDLHTEMLRSKYTPINSSSNSSGKSPNGKNDSLVKKDEHEHDSNLHTPKHSLFAEDKIWKVLQWQQIFKVGPGLNNLGNTCFLNSLIQCLTYTPPFANYLLSRDHGKTCKISGFCMFCVLEKHVVKALSGTAGSSFSPNGIVSNLKSICKHFRLGRQEDSHEFLRYVVEALQKSALHGFQDTIKKVDPHIAETSVIHRIFGGHLQSQVKCSECSYKSNTFDPFLDLSLEIKNCMSVEKALQAFTRVEILDKENKYKCPKCNKYVQAQKQFTIRKVPNVLTIQLKRFNFSGAFGGKIQKPVSFPEKLDLKPFVSTTKDPSGPANFTCTYNLYGVLVHAGESTRSGHYYSFVKSPAGVWYSMNDSSVSQVSLNAVLSQKAYMLFYVRDPPKMIKKKKEMIPASNSIPKNIQEKSEEISVKNGEGTHKSENGVKEHSNHSNSNGHSSNNVNGIKEPSKIANGHPKVQTKLDEKFHQQKQTHEKSNDQKEIMKNDMSNGQKRKLEEEKIEQPSNGNSSKKLKTSQEIQNPTTPSLTSSMEMGDDELGEKVDSKEPTPNIINSNGSTPNSEKKKKRRKKKKKTTPLSTPDEKSKSDDANSSSRVETNSTTNGNGSLKKRKISAVDEDNASSSSNKITNFFEPKNSNSNGIEKPSTKKPNNEVDEIFSSSSKKSNGHNAAHANGASEDKKEKEILSESKKEKQDQQQTPSLNFFSVSKPSNGNDDSSGKESNGDDEKTSSSTSSSSSSSSTSTSTSASSTSSKKKEVVTVVWDEAIDRNRDGGGGYSIKRTETLLNNNNNINNNNNVKKQSSIVQTLVGHKKSLYNAKVSTWDEGEEGNGATPKQRIVVDETVQFANKKRDDWDVEYDKGKQKKVKKKEEDIPTDNPFQAYVEKGFKKKQNAPSEGKRSGKQQSNKGHFKKKPAWLLKKQAAAKNGHGNHNNNNNSNKGGHHNKNGHHNNKFKKPRHN